MKRMLLKRGFTDRLYYYNFRMVWIFTMSCLLLNAFSGEHFLDVEELAIISFGIPAAFAELALHTGLVVWKAKVENCRKNKDINRMEKMEEEL